MTGSCCYRVDAPPDQRHARPVEWIKQNVLRVEDLKEDVEQNGPRQLSPRDLIGLWDYQRRTSICTDTVDDGLAAAGLVVEPHFTAVQLDDLSTVANAAEAEPAAGTDETLRSSAPHLPGSDSQGTLSWRIGSLPLPKKIATVTTQQPGGCH